MPDAHGTDGGTRPAGRAAAATRVEVRRNAYADSVALMTITAAVARLPGVDDAAVVMATDLNRDVLRAAGLLVPGAEAAGPNDLVIVVRASDEVVADAALAQAAALLSERRRTPSGTLEEEPPRSIRGAVRRLLPAANLAFISVPGAYAAGEAWQALANGLHVFLFSDNVPIEDEVALKRAARAAGLLVMGPDCGTGILNGVGLGFANVVRRGSIGVVGASGTGMQEITTLLHRAGLGISQAIGTGGRDLSERVGGITTLQALELLRDDPDTRAIVLISKPGSAAVGERVLRAAAETGRPVVACLLGASPEPPPGVTLASSLFDAARRAAAAIGADGRWDWAEGLEVAGRLRPSGSKVRGLYCGGTLRDEADQILGGCERELTDFGDDRFTRGRAHPMIDPTLRNQALVEAADDPSIGVILFDVILGHGAHPDPAGQLEAPLGGVATRARRSGRQVGLVAHVLGTELDPQGLVRQEQVLREAGALVFPANDAAARAAARLIRAGGEL